MGNLMTSDAGNKCVQSSGSKAQSAKTAEPTWKAVMGKYSMDMSEEGHMGAGTSSICRKGKANTSGDLVAIKVYKSSTKSGKSDRGTKLVKFKRQIDVLKKLQDPFVMPADPRLWCEQLERAKPARLFMRLYDHSVDEKGEPGPDTADGVLYVITELAQYSLKDFLADQKSRGLKSLSKETVKDLTKALVLVMAGLHAKGMVHLDMKPENLMVFDGCLKLIDVDGCVEIGKRIAVTDPSISFSPCYCAPEWANFLLAEEAQSITAEAALDVWSVGCTACEFVTLDAILKPTYANFLRNSRNHREAGFLFMDWLGAITKPPTPKKVNAFEPDFVHLINNMLLIPDRNVRKTCAECLSESAYLSAGRFHRSKTNPLSVDAADAEEETPRIDMLGERKVRHRLEDHSGKAMYKGVLWKLNYGQDPKDASQWLERAMWIANNGSLCYFSQRDDKRLVLLDSHKLHLAEITRPTGLAKDHAIRIQCQAETADGDEENDAFFFASPTPEEADEWLRFLTFAAHMDVIPTMFLGSSMAEELQVFRSDVKNRRMKVENDYQHHFEPVFKAPLWKVKTAGDRMVESDWFKRDAWLSRNGSLVYWSVRDGRELVYFSSADVHRAEVLKIDSDKSCKPWSFQVILPPHEGMAFAPGEFAAESDEMRTRWLQEFAKFKS